MVSEIHILSYSLVCEQKMLLMLFSIPLQRKIADIKPSHDRVVNRKVFLSLVTEAFCCLFS